MENNGELYCMKTPKNMSKKDVLDKIELVINRIAPKYTFPGYEIDDIKQESFLICVDALNRYDQNRPLENFLSVNLSNRLKNFIRDNNFTKSDEEKRKVMLPVQLSNECSIEDNCALTSLETKEAIHIIDTKLPVEYRSDYLKILNNVHVSKKRREEVSQVIKQLLEDNGYA